MKIYTIDSRRVGIVLTRDDSTYWTPTMGKWMAPFMPAIHVIPFAPRDTTAGSFFAKLQSADVGTVLQTYPDAQVLYVILDSTSGQPTSIESVWAPYALAPYPTPTAWLVTAAAPPVGPVPLPAPTPPNPSA